MKKSRKIERKSSSYLSLIELGALEDFNVSGDESGIVLKVHSIKNKIIRDFGPSDIRICLTQGIGLYYLVPKALDILEKDPWIETDHFPGDLFKAFISLPNDYWTQNPKDQERARLVVQFAKEILSNQGDSSTRQMKKDIDIALNKFSIDTEPPAP